MTPHAGLPQIVICLFGIAVIVPLVVRLIRHELKMNRKELPR